MGFWIFLGLYVTGATLTARHLVYARKLANEKTLYYGVQLRPKLYSQQELHQIRVRRGAGDSFPDSDYRDIATAALFFWVYWIWIFVKTVVEVTLTSGLKKTPGELQEEKDQREREAAARRLRLQKIEEETERLRREQDY